MSTDAKAIAPKPKRRWFQFRLRTLLGLIALAGIGMALVALAVVLHVLLVVPAERERQVVAAVRNLGGDVYYTAL